MFTWKWHALDDLCEALPRFGGIESLQTRVYEALHKQFQTMNTHSSSRNRSAMDEVVASQCNKRAKAFNMGFNLRCLKEIMETITKETLMMNLAVLRRYDTKITLSTLELLMLELGRREEGPLDRGEETMTAREAKDTLQDNGNQVFV